MLPLYVVDAFTSAAFAGNPAAVVWMESARDDAWMTAVAGEMKHSETAFVAPRPDGAFDLRWFTPEVEVDLCGHATLATSHALLAANRAESPITFHTRSGVLTATQTDAGIELDFPAKPAAEQAAPAGLFEALGVASGPVLTASFFTTVVVDSPEIVRDLTPDLDALARIETDAVNVTARAGDDIVVRVFGPRIGIPEDPVTGAAQCVLAPYWVPKLGSNSYTAHQLSERGGELRVRLDGDRVRIAGDAVTIVEGTLRA